jgi:hypothetical protein
MVRSIPICHLGNALTRQVHEHTTKLPYHQRPLCAGRGKFSGLMADVAQGIKAFRKARSEDDKPADTHTKPAKTIDRWTLGPPCAIWLRHWHDLALGIERIGLLSLMYPRCRIRYASAIHPRHAGSRHP